MGVDPIAEAVVASVADPARFGEVFDRYHPVMWRYLARTAGPDLADDLAGDVFAAAFGARHRFDPDRGQVHSWLYGIAANHARSALRSNGRSRRALQRAARAPAEQSDVAALDDAHWRADRIRKVQHAMSALEPEEFDVLTLVAWEQLSYQEAADALAVPIGTVRSRLHRARSRLRSLIEDDLEPARWKERPTT